ncbi:isopenicillin synthase [Streptomyces agglomeratus]|uniref:Isopenicillin synthase n=1 Tax=Streptomyces agglomeratus TaxID=285458 RepID=A0A1E5P4K1_9ACTN|nr:2-oxoglutarate and iron-dependent oxygenase domain-containing protein [Streptomyces agglomeratus]OEJ24397.1 isopenicillin synthase [Streptomyces agglomeratus]OEJ41651.1 isopenicillin synthase [Streptomyces agglomeratus]OEJ43970.1 isopenicillin synthase [Streptomyces agglomeratus]OEJ54142.1 isopenicillin synthase [Streptomyces agglomeratus]OEJ61514.1 isopenicillin synthase [Streptomyces agglomeratus]
MTALPVIDLEHARDGDEVKVADEISRACTEVGFFVVRGHGIDRKVFDDAYELSLDFFRRPAAEKNALPMRTSTARGDNDYSPYGYSALLSENAYAYTGKQGMPSDYVEKFSVGRLVTDDAEELPFPADERGAALRAALKTYFAACETVAARLTELLTVALELPRDFFATRTDRSNDSLRSQFYPGVQQEFANDQGMGEHTDGTLITLLTEDGPGLQLRDLKGEWLDVDVPERDWFIVNIGDLMARWSNDEYVSTPHRVRLVDSPRQSIVFFKLANDDAIIECFPKFTRDRAAAYEPIRYEDFSLQKMDALFGRETRS